MYSQRSKGKVKPIYFDNASSSIRSEHFVKNFLLLFGTKRTKKQEQELLVKAEKRIASFLGLEKNQHTTISFVPNATYGLNEIAYSLTPNKSILKAEKIKQDIYLSDSEHAANHLIWLKLSSKPINYFCLRKFGDLKLPKTPSIFSFVCTSNLEGISVNLNEIENKFKNKNHICIVDATQLLQYQLPNLKDSCIDYLVFTAHKCFGPNGIAVVYSKNQNNNIGINSRNYFYLKGNYRLCFDALEAWINSLDYTEVLYKNNYLKEKKKELNEFFIRNFPLENKHIELVNKDTQNLIFLLKIKSKYLSSHDYAFYLNKKNVIVRPGISCSWLGGKSYNADKIIRVSLGPFNTKKEIKTFFELIKKFSLEQCL